MNWYNHVGIALCYVVMAFVLAALGGSKKATSDDRANAFLLFSMIFALVHLGIFLATL